ncbi:FAD-dependent oxidoreductase [Phycicoccus endophyticus]|uniref:FAD-dependent oxidoreductase n=1 Tax=Phycicoccus endophyticus TaxID=1690220 RepID=UPI0014093873|nr:FAD-dependent oxidoreductase [Phycicoccus endophyticus]NHI19398.1 FAD-dependent oxidoreductase [Phycicoccus endophyticus]GGL38764.1 isorenieratene synthase [Phycicoccus endophyticus]
MSLPRRRPRWRPGADPRAVFHRPPRPAAGPGHHEAAERHVVVVGGGIAGVTAAVGLAERGVRVTLLERDPRLGGRVASWPVTLPDGSSSQMSRGFHAFFRQYYNLRALLRRTDPTLERLRPLPDYPLVRAGGGADSFAGIPRTPPWNLAAFVARSPSFDLAGLRGVDVEQALGLLDVDLPASFTALDGVSAAEVLDRLRFPEAARHLALEVFARSFFADPRAFSGAELVAMFHLYFVGSAEGLLFDVPGEDYDSALWAPLGRYLQRLGVEVRVGREVGAVVESADGGLRVRHAEPGADGDRELAADAVVLALDPPGLRRVVAASPGLGSPGWREQVAAVRSAPPFAVWRLWLDGRVAPQRPAFLGTSGYGPLDNVSVLERFEGHAARWSATHGGSVVELHAYALTEDARPAQVRAELRAALAAVYPETAGMGVLHEEWLLREDCVLVGLEPWASRPGVATPDPRVVLAGDAVRVELPVALMERAATSGWLAADRLLTGWGLPGHGVWSVPLTGRLGPLPGLTRRGLRAVRAARARRGG